MWSRALASSCELLRAFACSTGHVCFFRYCYFPHKKYNPEALLKRRTHKTLEMFGLFEVRRVFAMAITKHFKTALEMGKTIFEASENESKAAKIAQDAILPPRGSAGLYEEAGISTDTSIAAHSTPKKVNLNVFLRALACSCVLKFNTRKVHLLMLN
jgi:hypothetical protein